MLRAVLYAVWNIWKSANVDVQESGTFVKLYIIQSFEVLGTFGGENNKCQQKSATSLIHIGSLRR